MIMMLLFLRKSSDSVNKYNAHKVTNITEDSQSCC